MATTTENVVVNLKVNADGVSQGTQEIEAQSKAVNTLNLNLGDLNVNAKGLIENTLKVNVGLRVVAATFLKGTVAAKALNAATFKVEKVVARLAVRLGLTNPLIAAAVLAITALVVVIKSWNAAAADSVQVQRNLAVATDFSTRNWQSWLSVIRPATEAVNLWTRGVKDAIITSLGWNNVIARNRLLAEVAANAHEDFTKKIANEAFELEKLNTEVARLNIELGKEGITDERRITLLEDIRKTEEAIALIKTDNLETEKELIEGNIEQYAAGNETRLAGEARIRDINLEILKTANAELRAKEKLITATFNILNNVKAINEESVAPDLVGEDAVDDNVQKELDDFSTIVQEKKRSFAEFVADVNAEVIDDTADRIEIIEEMEQEHAERLTAEFTKGAKARIAWAELESSTKLSLAANLANSLSEITQKNFEISKAFAIAGAIISTAGGVARALDDFKAPISYVVAAVTAAAGLAQVTTIANTQPGGAAGNIGRLPSSGQIERTSLRGPEANASNAFFENNRQFQRQQQQPVLVVEDLTTVQQRIVVTEQRTSI